MTRCMSTVVAAGFMAASLLMLTAVRADGHHSNAAFFDVGRTVTVKGVVKKWDFRNPHPLLYIDVTDENGQTTEWLLQFTNVTRIRRMGVTARTFLPGMVVTATGNPLRVPGEYGMNTQLVILPDGTQIKAPAGG